MTTTTFGYMKAWAKKTLEEIFAEFEIEDGLLLSGKIQLKPEQAQQLIEYLSDSVNSTQYGYSLDFALFYKGEDTVNIGGKITTPYKKDDDSAKRPSTAAKRKI